MKLLILIIFVLTVLVGCSTPGLEPVPAASADLDSPVVEWRSAELVDVSTQQVFRISDFDKPVLVESFAVWCPTCTKQQREIKALHEELGDAIVSISLDTDPNENKQQVLAHIERNGFDWRYAIAPPEISQSLIKEFGVSVVNAPSAPVILVCNNNARLLKRGVKSTADLKEELAKC